MFSNFKRLIDTVAFLKPVQIYYRIIFQAKNFFIRSNQRYKSSFTEYNKINWKDGYYNIKTFFGCNEFKFINIKHKFENDVDWNIKDYDKLWNINLNYFDYLNQKNISKSEGVELILEFCNKYQLIKDGLESYPTSLRIINWIKFISKHKIYNHNILKIIRLDSERLYYNLEYHLLGNHILENAFGIWFSAHLFDDPKYFTLGQKLLRRELNEQILDDGGHFELSPMYHQIILIRILDCVNLSEMNVSKFNNNFSEFLREKASLMNSWLTKITYNDGRIPLVNDSAYGVYPNSLEIRQYCESLNIKGIDVRLLDSGYRLIKSEKYELLIDVGKIVASYIPGHTHADTFNYELKINNEPVIVDTGTSCYDNSKFRIKERSTSSHNTVSVNGLNSSDVWKIFRVGKRANVQILKESTNLIEAEHDGYKSINVKHVRKWQWERNKITINDKLSCSTENAVAYMHFHPDVNFKIKRNTIKINGKCNIEFLNFRSIKVREYLFAQGFNQRVTGQCIEIHFDEHMITKIDIF